jgi:hypothetical protein
MPSAVLKHLLNARCWPLVSLNESSLSCNVSIRIINRVLQRAALLNTDLIYKTISHMRNNRGGSSVSEKHVF